MEFELGLKLTKCLDEFESADLVISKDGAGPVFISRETETMFILTAHLRGYKREHMKIGITEDGSRIVISGERPVQETVMVGWQIHKKGVEMRGFRKAFKIPDGVILDKINASFNQDESMLTISMKKAIKGIKGVKVEEVKEETTTRGDSESLQVKADPGTSGKQVSAEVANEEGSENKTLLVKEKEEMVKPWDKKAPVVEEYVPPEGGGSDEAAAAAAAAAAENEEGKKFIDQSTQRNAPERPKKLCTPVIAAGSSLLVAVIVFVIHLIRTKDKPEKKK